MRNKRRISKFIIVATSVAMMIVSVLPLLIEAFYALPDGDDFHYMYLMTDNMDQGFGYMKSAFYVMIERYMSWQGLYFSNLIQNYISPFLRGGMLGYSLCMAGITVTFFAIQYICCYIICANKKRAIFIYLTVIMVWTAVANPGQDLYWCSAAFGYTVPLCVGELGLCIFYKSINDEERKNWRTISLLSGAILVFMACGGTLQMAMLFSYVVTVMCGYFVVTKKYNKQCLVLLISAYMGTVLNLVAPGNYIRKSEVQSNLAESNISLVVKALVDSVKMTIHLSRVVIVNGVFLGICILSLVILLLESSDEETNSFQIIIIGLVIGLGGTIVQLFPVCLGYGSAIYIERNTGIALLGISFVFVNVMLLFEKTILGQIRRLTIANSRFVLLIIGLFAVVLLIYGEIHSSGIRAWSELVSGKASQSYKDWKYIYKSVDESDEENVYIEINHALIDGLLVENTYVDALQDISPSYIRFSKKNQLK